MFCKLRKKKHKGKERNKQKVTHTHTKKKERIKNLKLVNVLEIKDLYLCCSK